MSYKGNGSFTCDVYIGPPGSGKTTKISSLVREAVASGANPMICSLTRTASAEVASRDLSIPRENIGTLHSHALAALDKPALTEGNLKEWNRLYPHYSLASGGADGSDPYARRLDRGPDLMAKLDLMRARCVPPELWPTELSVFAGQWQEWKDNSRYVDFTDLIELAVKKNTPIPHGCDMIFADEAQDLSELELRLLKHWALQARSLTIVGDPWQSLYGWRGAHPEMFDSESIKAGRRHVLSQSYRVPRRVHAAAIGLIKKLSCYSPIDYAPTDQEGSVRQVEYGMSFPMPIVQEASKLAAQGRTVMIAASCGYMLNGIIEELRRTGEPFANPWRTKNGRWNPLQGGRGVSMRQRIHEFMIPIEGVSHSETSNSIIDDGRTDINHLGPRSWTVKEVSRWSGALTGVLVRGAKKYLRGAGAVGGTDHIVTLDELNDWFDFIPASNLASIMDGMVDQHEALTWYGDHLSRDKKKPAEAAMAIARRHGSRRLRDAPKIYVGTIHSFKGAEADTVILIPDLSSSGFREWSGSPKAKDSVIRMFYVGMTRARRQLILCRASTTRAANIWETA